MPDQSTGPATAPSPLQIQKMDTVIPPAHFAMHAGTMNGLRCPQGRLSARAYQQLWPPPCQPAFIRKGLLPDAIPVL